MSLSWEDESLAAALAIQRLHGADGPRWIAERIGQAALDGDAAGIAKLKRIAAEYDKLMGSTRH